MQDKILRTQGCYKGEGRNQDPWNENCTCIKGYEE